MFSWKDAIGVPLKSEPCMNWEIIACVQSTAKTIPKTTNWQTKKCETNQTPIKRASSFHSRFSVNENVIRRTKRLPESSHRKTQNFYVLQKMFKPFIRKNATSIIRALPGFYVDPLNRLDTFCWCLYSCNSLLLLNAKLLLCTLWRSLWRFVFQLNWRKRDGT